MVPMSGGVQSALPSLGDAGHGSSDIPPQTGGSMICGKIVGSFGGCDRFVSGVVGAVQSHLLLPSFLTDSLSTMQNRGRRDPGHTSGPGLASLFLVCQRDAVGGRRSLSQGPVLYPALPFLALMAWLLKARFFRTGVCLTQ